MNTTSLLEKKSKAKQHNENQVVGPVLRFKLAFKIVQTPWVSHIGTSSEFNIFGEETEKHKRTYHLFNIGFLELSFDL